MGIYYEQCTNCRQSNANQLSLSDLSAIHEVIQNEYNDWPTVVNGVADRHLQIVHAQCQGKTMQSHEDISPTQQPEFILVWKMVGNVVDFGQKYE